MLVSSLFDVLSLSDNADYWRNRAEKAREMAASMNEQNSRQTIIGVAKEYERMAELAEKRMKSRVQNSGTLGCMSERPRIDTG